MSGVLTPQYAINYSERMGRLKIIKASAGSGKTHTLTGEYLSLLMSGERKYRNILAVTFTNKATEEMKRRVIETLFKESLKSDTARRRLTEILHDYSSFSILTIDRFFQQTLRAFAREIGKNNSYAVELDQDMVLSEAIDNMVLNLDKEQNSDLLDWLTAISFDAIEQGSDWNFRKGIKEISSEIFKESFRLKKNELLPESLNKKALSAFKNRLKAIINDFEKQAKEISEKAIEIINRFELSLDDFPYKKSSGVNFFFKCAVGEFVLPGSRFTEMADNIEKWRPKSMLKSNPVIYDRIERAYHEGLNGLCVDMLALFDNNAKKYYSAVVSLSNINTLGLIIDIERYVREYTKDNNLVLIPETTELLNKIIDGSDTPFIYEKVGTRIDHFMLDEFQDTSLLQWLNFKPLIENSLASGNNNLIVGDVKQSIYRWRGSDWNLLNGSIYNHIDKELAEESDLNFNWRSAQEIVSFNREFFSYASSECSRLTGSALFDEVYSNVNQKIPEKNATLRGHVHLKFFEKREGDQEWTERALDQIKPLIEKYRENGYRYRDITILVRKNTQGESVVKNLISYDIPVISEESLLVSSSVAVRKIITTLKAVNNPDDSVNNLIAHFNSVAPVAKDESDQLSLYEMCEKIVMDIQDQCDNSDAIYIQSFLDIVSDFLKTGKTDLANFIEWWELKGRKRSVPAPSGQDAVRVMTIHKAKGLGIPVVIIPFFEAELDHSNANIFPQILWCKSDIEPFNSIPLIPVKYSQKLQETIFSEEYTNERVRAYVDNLNVAYVAMTRAEREMAIFAPAPEKSTKASLSGMMFSMYGGILNADFSCDEGEWTKTDYIYEQQTDNVYIPQKLSIPYGDRLRMRLKGEDYYNRQSRRNYGLVMHSVLSRVQVEEDLKKSLEISVSQGELHKDEFNDSYEFLDSCLESVRERHWFDGTYKVYNELEIIEPGGVVSRPDRVLLGAEAVVIDFKFGKKREQSHVRQVEKYVKLMKSMGLAFVKGYLWYPEDNEVIEIK